MSGTFRHNLHVSISGLKLNSEIMMIVLISLLMISIFLMLYVFRLWDDNRLTSWAWVFIDVNVGSVIFYLCVGIFFAYGCTISKVGLFVIRYLRTQESFWIFISVFLVSIFFRNVPEVIVDASRYFIQAKYLEIYGFQFFFTQWGKTISVWTDLPLVPFLYGFVFKVFGEHRIAIELVNSLFFSGTVLLTYHIGKILWHKTIGLYASLLLLAIPYLLVQLPLMLVDVASMFFFTLAVFSSIKAAKHGGTLLLIISALTFIVAMLSKYSLWLMLAVIPVIFLCYWNIGPQVVMRRFVFFSLIVLLLFSLLLFWNGDLIITQLKFLLDYQMPGLKRWTESFTSTFLFQIHPFVSLAALYSIYAAIKNRDIKYVIVSFLLLLVFLLQLRRARYLIVILPMLVLMAAYGLNEITNSKITNFVVSATVITAIIIALFCYVPFLQKTSAINVSQAGRYLDNITEKNSDTIEVQILTQPDTKVNPAVVVATLDLFTQKKIDFHYSRIQFQPPDSVEKSPLRFTWEYKNPHFFRNNVVSNSINVKRRPLVIIFGKTLVIPLRLIKKMSDYRFLKEFVVSDNIFLYQTKIRLYLPIQ